MFPRLANAYNGMDFSTNGHSVCTMHHATFSALICTFPLHRVGRSIFELPCTLFFALLGGLVEVSLEQ